MRRKHIAMAAAGVLSLCSNLPAFAGSVTQPGETVGIATGAPLPPGLYFVNTADWGSRNRNDRIGDQAVGLDIPVVAWSTPWQLLGGRLQFLAAWPVLEAGVSENRAHDASYTAGAFNPLILGQLAWDLGGGFGFSYAIGAYFEFDSGTAFDSTSLNQRFGLSYTANNWNLSANIIWGIHLDSVSDEGQFSPCPATSFGGFGANRGCNPDFVNIDMAATKKLGKWEVGPVAFASWDVSEPIEEYRQQNQFAVGGLVGYDFGPVTLQTYVTTDVVQHHYDGYDTRGWFRIILPLNKLEPPATVSQPRY